MNFPERSKIPANTKETVEAKKFTKEDLKKLQEDVANDIAQKNLAELFTEFGRELQAPAKNAIWRSQDGSTYLSAKDYNELSKEEKAKVNYYRAEDNAEKKIFLHDYADVIMLQAILKKISAEDDDMKCDPGDVDGVWTGTTKIALEAFQKKYNETKEATGEKDKKITTDGEFGPATLAALEDYIQVDHATLGVSQRAEVQQKKSEKKIEEPKKAVAKKPSQKPAATTNKTETTTTQPTHQTEPNQTEPTHPTEPPAASEQNNLTETQAEISSAERLEAAHNYDGAIDEYQKLLSTDPNNQELLNSLRRVFKDKIAYVRELLVKDPDNYEKWLNIGRTHESLGDREENLEKKKKIYEAALDELWEGLGIVRRKKSNPYYEGIFNDEIKKVRLKIELIEKNLAPQDTVTSTQAVKNEKPETPTEAPPEKIPPTESPPAQTTAPAETPELTTEEKIKKYHESGLAFANGNYVPEAIRDFERALVLDPNNSTINADLGNAYLMASDLDKAAAAFKKAVEADPELQVARYNLAYILRKQGKFAEAANEYGEFVVRDAKDPDAWYAYATSLEAMGDKAGAANAYEKYAEVETKSSQNKWVEEAREKAKELRAQEPLPAKTPSDSQQDAVTEKISEEQTLAELKTTPLWTKGLIIQPDRGTFKYHYMATQLNRVFDVDILPNYEIRIYSLQRNGGYTSSGMQRVDVLVNLKKDTLTRKAINERWRKKFLEVNKVLNLKISEYPSNWQPDDDKEPEELATHNTSEEPPEKNGAVEVDMDRFYELKKTPAFTTEKVIVPDPSDLKEFIYMPDSSKPNVFHTVKMRSPVTMIIDFKKPDEKIISVRFDLMDAKIVTAAYIAKEIQKVIDENVLTPPIE